MPGFFERFRNKRLEYDETSTPKLRSSASWFIVVVLLIVLIQVGQLSRSLIRLRANDACNSFQVEANSETVQKPSKITEHDCGRNPIEAEAKGCVFDLMRNNWTPKACYNATAALTASAQNPWPFYRDKKGTIPITMPDIQYESQVWSHYGYHRRHCGYVFETAKRSLKPGNLVPEDIATVGHLVHCGLELADLDKHRDESRIGTQVVFGTVACVEYT